MDMDGNDFIEFAGKLAASKTCGPAGYRSATSRAYYGAFHLARSFLHQSGFYSVKGGNEHQWVHRHFLNCQFNEAREAGRLLENLHESRKEADYDLARSYADDAKNARACVDRADRIRDRINRCSAPENLSVVQTEMLHYRKLAGLT